MLKFFKLTTLFMMISFSASAFSDAPKNPPLFYTEAKPNIILSGKERTFTIRLKSNPTTGYQWYLREYHSKMITPIAHRFIPSETKLIGSGGFEEWEFRVSDQAIAYPHQLILRMIYARPFQGAEASTTVVFRISTHP